MMQLRYLLFSLLLTSACFPEQAFQPPSWVIRSNQNAKILLDVAAQFYPEDATWMGVTNVDDQIIDLDPKREARANESALAELERRTAQENDLRVKQDLILMTVNVRRQLEGSELRQKHLIRYYNVPQIVFQGISSLLNDQVPPARRNAALVRLRKYAGLERGYQPLTKLAEAQTSAGLELKDRRGPFRDRLLKDIATQNTYLDELPELFQKYKIDGYRPALNALREQFREYADFLTSQLLPRARTDFRLPPEWYSFVLRNVGVAIPPEELAAQAHGAFHEIQNEMMVLAPEVARDKGLPYTDYRDVIRALRQDQWTSSEVVSEYEKRVEQIDGIIQREHLVSLPDRSLQVRLASAAESASMPSPSARAPRKIGNTTEGTVLLLPVRVPPPANIAERSPIELGDYMFPAASWTLAAHEGRPGHALQFDAEADQGISIARSLFGNGGDVSREGWALYAEAMMQPFMPIDGQLICLQQRLLRAARAFLDPDLQAGKITVDQAKEVLVEEVAISPTLAQQEVERYTFQNPGQATAYFYGYSQLMQLRSDTEKAMGRRFSQQKFHDFILQQGALPPNLWREAIVESFILPEHGQKDTANEPLRPQRSPLPAE